MGAGDSKVGKNGIPLLDTSSDKALKRSFMSRFNAMEDIYDRFVKEFEALSRGKPTITKEQWDKATKSELEKLQKTYREKHEKLERARKAGVKETGKLRIFETIGIPDDFFTRIWNLFDFEGNGEIDLAEYLLFKGYMSNNRFYNAVAVFVSVDEDMNGHIEGSEMRKIFEAMVCEEKETSVITERQSQLIDESIAAYTKKADADGNTTIELMEFINSYDLFEEELKRVLASI